MADISGVPVPGQVVFGEMVSTDMLQKGSDAVQST